MMSRCISSVPSALANEKHEMSGVVHRPGDPFGDLAWTDLRVEEEVT
jgi:hypothetical protein